MKNVIKLILNKQQICGFDSINGNLINYSIKNENQVEENEEDWRKNEKFDMFKIGETLGVYVKEQQINVDYAE